MTAPLRADQLQALREWCALDMPRIMRTDGLMTPACFDFVNAVVNFILTGDPARSPGDDGFDPYGEAPFHLTGDALLRFNCLKDTLPRKVIISHRDSAAAFDEAARLFAFIKRGEVPAA